MREKPKKKDLRVNHEFIEDTVKEPKKEKQNLDRRENLVSFKYVSSNFYNDITADYYISSMVFDDRFQSMWRPPKRGEAPRFLKLQIK